MGSQPASPAVVRKMAILVFAGAVAAVGGGFLAVREPAWSYPREMRDHYCFGPGQDELTPGWQLWSVWLVLVGVVVAAVVTWRRHAPKNRRVAVVALMGVALTAILCPFLLAAGGAMSCGL